MGLISIIYASSATCEFSSADLAELLTRSRETNTRLGISGMLLHKDGNFMQVLEGEETAVRTLFDKIGRDPRHSGVLVFRRALIEERDFPDWSMAFHDLNGTKAKSIPGYSEFLNTALTGREFSENPTLCQKLLLTFKRNLRPDRPK